MTFAKFIPMYFVPFDVTIMEVQNCISSLFVAGRHTTDFFVYRLCIL